MSTDVEDLLEPVGSTTWRGAHYITWFGEKLCEFGRDADVEVLAHVLYSFGYVLGEVADLERAAPDGALHPVWNNIAVDRRLFATWDGWTPDAANPSRLTYPSQPAILVTAGQTLTLADGTLSVRVPTVSARRLPGWLHIHHGEISRPAASIRAYVNTSPDSARELAESMPGLLLDRGLEEFSMKFLMGSAHDLRADSSVIYLPPAPGALDAALELASAYVRYPDTPLLTLRVTDGVAVAQSPQSGDSFGMTRCRQIAEAFIASHESSGRVDPLAALPFDASRPWDVTDSPLSVPMLTGTSSPAPDVTSAHARFERLAAELCSDALQFDGRATWLFREPGSSRVVTSGADVYRGSAGQLLVLAYATRLLGDGRYRLLLRATARDMLLRVGELEFNGFHVGPAGTAAALAEAAVISQDAAVHDAAIACLAVVGGVGHTAQHWDVINGLSGRLLGMSMVADLLDHPLRDLADDLSALAAFAHDDPGRGHARWRLSTGRRRPALAGLAHGGSGAALGIAAGSPDALTLPALAARSIQFEDDVRSRDDNWIDYRLPSAPQPSVTWCNGAVGIGLATVALATRFQTADLWARAKVAADRCSVGASQLRRDASLCHGASGLALAVYCMGRLLGDEALVDESRALVTMSKSTTDDNSLFTGRSGIVLAHMAIDGFAWPPAAFVLDHAVWKSCSPTA